MHACMHRWLLSPFAGLRRWNKVFPGLKVSTSAHFMDQAVQLCCSQGFVPRALFRIVTEPLTAFSCTSFVVIFLGMVFKISVRCFVIIPVAPIITGGAILKLFSFQDLLISFLRSWYLVIFLISVLFKPKLLGTVLIS